VRHSCLTAYFVAAEAVGAGRRPYEATLYSMPDDDPARPRTGRTLGPFVVDVYEYPPPFLLLPRALLVVVPDFLRLRMFWFALHTGVVLLAMLTLARKLGPAAGTRALLLVPLVLAAVPALSFLQKGNVQGTVIALSVCAMVLFERSRHAAGGALLAFATVSKLYPGMLVLYLLAQRRWRAVAWTAALGGVFALLSLLDTGWGTYTAFFGHLPGLLSERGLPGLPQPGRRGHQLFGAGARLQGQALRRAGDGLRRVQGRGLAVHDRCRVGHRRGRPAYAPRG
jgi:hypothetical protein